MTEWERTGNTVYRDKIVAGMKSIAALPNRIFTGPKALGFDPATGIITSECDPKLESSNHLMTIMGAPASPDRYAVGQAPYRDIHCEAVPAA